MRDRTSQAFRDPAGFAWFTRAGLDALLDALAQGETDQAERIAFNVYTQAARVEADLAGGTDRGGRP